MTYCQQIEWDDVPHLTEDQKAELYNSIPVHQRDARTKGIPILGSGVIYPIPEEQILCDPFKIEGWWPKAFGMDVGWNVTAGLWGAWDRESDTVYIYSEYYGAKQPPSVHADGFKSRGQWVPGAIDPASAGANQKDGTTLIDEYQVLGLNLHPADNTVEAGIHACYQRMAAGRLKVFRTCRNWLSEFRIYRRDEKGRVVKEKDHLMDCMRYLIMTGLMLATIDPDELQDIQDQIDDGGRNEHTGY